MRDLRTPSWAPGARFMLTAVALALFGLLSMHGWGSHTGGHTMAMSPASSAVSTDSSHAIGHGIMSDDSSTGSGSRTVDGSAPPVGHEKPDGDPGASLLGLCLAILCGLLLGIALLLARRSLRFPPWMLPIWRHPVFIGRERDPPDLLRLCVIRC